MAATDLAGRRAGTELSAATVTELSAATVSCSAPAPPDRAGLRRLHSTDGDWLKLVFVLPTVLPINVSDDPDGLLASLLVGSLEDIEAKLRKLVAQYLPALVPGSAAAQYTPSEASWKGKPKCSGRGEVCGAGLLPCCSGQDRWDGKMIHANSNTPLACTAIVRNEGGTGPGYPGVVAYGGQTRCQCVDDARLWEYPAWPETATSTGLLPGWVNPPSATTWCQEPVDVSRR